MEIFWASLGLDSAAQRQLEVSGIRLLRSADTKLIMSQLHGNPQN